MVTIRIPAPPPGLVSNLVGVLGLALIVVAVGALASWPWAVLVAGVAMVALATLAQAGTRAVVTPIQARRPERGAG